MTHETKKGYNIIIDGGDAINAVMLYRGEKNLDSSRNQSSWV